MLPEYCLRPASDTSNTPCGSDPGDVRTTDPGRAMVTGFIFDVGEFKPPILRNLSTRAPFFHNGAAATLDDLVNFYNARFGLGLSDQQHNDLVAFLPTLYPSDGAASEDGHSGGPRPHSGKRPGRCASELRHRRPLSPEGTLSERNPA